MVITLTDVFLHCPFSLVGGIMQKHSNGNARKDRTHMLHAFPTYSSLAKYITRGEGKRIAL